MTVYDARNAGLPLLALHRHPVSIEVCFSDGVTFLRLSQTQADELESVLRSRRKQREAEARLAAEGPRQQLRGNGEPMGSMV